MRPTKRSSNGVEEVSDLAGDARFVFQHSPFRELYGTSLYLPHQNVWWRVAMILLLAFSTWSLVSSYRRRAVRRREEQL